MLVNRSTILHNRIGIILTLFYINKYIKKISLSSIYYYSKLDTKLIFLNI